MPYSTYEESDHEGSEVELYLFETSDGKFKWTFTTDAQPIVIGLDTYIPEAISRGELNLTAGEAANERLTIKVPYNNPVAVLHVPYLPPRSVRVTVYSYQRRDGTVELLQGFYGDIMSFAQKDVEMEFYCSQIIDTMQQSVPWAVHKAGGCLWATYEAGCGVPRASFKTVVDDIVAVNGDLIQAPSIGAKPDGWFTGGYIEDETTGAVRFITEHVGSQIRLIYPFPELQTSALMSAYAGDDRQPETCRLKFNNKINYLGFDFFPEYNIFSEGVK